MKDDVKGFYTNSIQNESRWWYCGFKRAVFSGGLRYSFGIGFLDLVVPNLSAEWMDPILVPYRTAPLKLVLLVQILKKIALLCAASCKF